MIKKLICKLSSHRFNAWKYITPDSCEQVLVCNRCGFDKELRVVHQFGEWKFEDENSCEQVRICKRDHYVERRSAVHQFGDWEFDAGNSSKKVRICEKCREEEILFNSDPGFSTWGEDPTKMTRAELYNRGYISDSQYFNP